MSHALLKRASLALICALSLALPASFVGCDSGGKPGAGGHEEHEGHDEHEGEGPAGSVRLSADQVKRAGVVLETVKPGQIVERLSLAATVQPNLDAQVHLTPKVPGLVRSIRKQLGDQVTAGEILCELESTDLGAAASGYLVARASLSVAARRLEQERALLERGVKVADEVFAREERLKEQSITTMRPYYEAEIALAQARLGRDRRVLELEGEIQHAEIRLHAADEQLRILGLGLDQIEALARDEEHGHGRYPLRAPGGGVIVARDISENEHVETSSKLFVIQDLSHVWVVGSVYEQDLRRVARGQRAEVRLAAFPGVTLQGEVTFVAFEVDQRSRACQVRVVLKNEGVPGWKEPFPLRPGMFGEVDLVLAERAAPLVIAESAVVHEGRKTFVFVAEGEHADEQGHEEDGHGEQEHEGEEKSEHADEQGHEGHGHEEQAHAGEEKSEHAEEQGHAGKTKGHEGHGHERAGPEGQARTFVRRAVRLGVRSGERVEVLEGLKAGERVAARGSFTLESLARRGELGGGHSH